MYHPNEYKFLYSVGSDTCNVSIIDADIEINDDVVDDITNRYSVDSDWSDESVLSEIQNKYPGVLWIGDLQGSSGCHVYVHYIDNKIDSFVISISWID